MMRKFVLAVGLVLMASSAQAATLNVVGGILHGASDVSVDGNFYDVQFLDGTCIALFNGCDDVSDFTFLTSGEAALASTALVNQVFSGLPANLSLRGCFVERFDAIPCFALTSIGNHVDAVYGSFESARTDCGGNCVDTPDPITGHAGLFPRDYDMALEPFSSYAVWSNSAAVPEPNTALLLSLGLTGLAAKGRRSLRS